MKFLFTVDDGLAWVSLNMLEDALVPKCMGRRTLHNGLKDLRKARVLIRRRRWDGGSFYAVAANERELPTFPALAKRPRSRRNFRTSAFVVRRRPTEVRAELPHAGFVCVSCGRRIEVPTSVPPAEQRPWYARALAWHSRECATRGVEEPLFFPVDSPESPSTKGLDESAKRRLPPRLG